MKFQEKETRRAAFRSLVAAGNHLKANGRLVGYQVIADAVGVGKNTARRWMREDFPSIAEHVQAEPGAPGGFLADGSRADPTAVAAWRSAQSPLPSYAEVAAHFGLNYYTARKYCVAAEEPRPSLRQQQQDARADFMAFMQAGKYQGREGAPLTLREIGAALGKPSSTIYRWMVQYFPDVARLMEGRTRT